MTLMSRFLIYIAYTFQIVLPSQLLGFCEYNPAFMTTVGFLLIRLKLAPFSELEDEQINVCGATSDRPRRTIEPAGPQPAAAQRTTTIIIVEQPEAAPYCAQLDRPAVGASFIVLESYKWRFRQCKAVIHLFSISL